MDLSLYGRHYLRAFSLILPETLSAVDIPGFEALFDIYELAVWGPTSILIRSPNDPVLYDFSTVIEVNAASLDRKQRVQNTTYFYQGGLSLNR